LHLLTLVVGAAVGLGCVGFACAGDLRLTRLHLLTLVVGAAVGLGCVGFACGGICDLCSCVNEGMLADNVVGTPYMVSAQLALGTYIMGGRISPWPSRWGDCGNGFPRHWRGGLLPHGHISTKEFAWVLGMRFYIGMGGLF
ncbi:MAG: hypothetical protein RSA55_08290, partial [Clostridia bacterium]